MDTQQNTALTRALAEVPGPLPTSGVIHITLPHTDRFTVVGNHLAQHPDLSCTAVGLAVRIQSLPQGAKVGIKALAARCTEGEKRIAAALRELEAHGYLRRVRDRLPSGRIITRTVFCNRPTALLRPRHPAVAPPQPAKPEPAPTAEAPAPDLPAPQPAPPQAPLSVPPSPAPLFVPRVPPPTAPMAPRRPLPRPSAPTPALDRAATPFPPGMHRHAAQFMMPAEKRRRLV
ncbi:hypothetical protein PV370_17975, partial [Streptomyces sp. NE06-03C]|nr:hypothetical protein [Streptomyces sp. NE06-03C]